MSFFEPPLWRRESLGPPPPPFQIPARRATEEQMPLLKWFVLGGFLLLLFIAANVGKSLYAEWLWFDSLGFSSVYTTILQAQALLFVLGAAAFLALFVLMGGLRRATTRPGITRCRTP